jgi:hypothetical protein
MAKILRRRGIRFWLAIFGVRVHVGMGRAFGVVRFFDGRAIFALDLRVAFVVRLTDMMFMRIVFVMFVVLM